MADYSPTTDFSAKDALDAGDANKVIRGADVDTELNNIATAIASKAETDPTEPATYGTVAAVGTPAVGDEVLLHDISGNVVGKTTVAELTAGSGVAATREVNSGTGITGGGDLTADRTLALDTANDRNVDHSAVDLTAGAGLTGGGTIDDNRTFSVGQGEGLQVNADSVDLAVNGLDELAETPNAADFVPVYDTSGTAHKKVLFSNFMTATSGTIVLGGVRIQYGLATGLSDSVNTTVTFPIAFSGAPYNVQLTTLNTGIGLQQYGLQVISAAAASFVIAELDGPNSNNSAYWLAIGPA